MTPEIKAIAQSLEQILTNVNEQAQLVNDDRVADLMVELTRLQNNIQKFSSHTSSLIELVKESGRNLLDAPTRLLSDLKDQDTAHRIAEMLNGNAADLLGIPVTADQIDAAVHRLQNLPTSPPPIPTGLPAKLNESIVNPGKALIDELNDRIPEVGKALKDGHAKIKEIPDEVFQGLETTLNERVAELEGSFSETIELGEELMEELDGGVGDLFGRAEAAVSNLVDAWDSLADVWNGMNDDLPEAKGTLGDVQSAIEDTKYVVDEVVDMM